MSTSPAKIEFRSELDGKMLIIPLLAEDAALRAMHLGDEVVAHGPLKILVDYPLNTPCTLEFRKSEPVTRRRFHNIVMKGYRRIYEVENQTTKIAAGCIPNMFNRNTTNGKYGIWGHFIEQLWLVDAELKDGVYHLEVDS